MQKKVAYNACYGGFCLSPKAISALKNMGINYDNDWFYNNKIDRHDPSLIKVIEDLGVEASGPNAYLKIAIIDGDQYKIEDYDGFESVLC